VTADNPQGALGSEDENRARRAALAAYLDGRDLVWHPALGGDPNGDHLEPGALVLGLDMSSAAALGARFDQAAVYVWTPAALHLLACTEPRREILGYRVISRPSALPPPPLRPPPPAGTSGPGDPQKNCR
jgi:hypothetical protein